MAQSDVREVMIASADYLTETPSSDLTSLSSLAWFFARSMPDTSIVGD